MSEFFFRFGQILFNLARALKAHHKENLCFLSFLSSPLITYLIILCLENEIIVLEKKSGRSLEFWIQKSVRTLEWSYH